MHEPPTVAVQQPFGHDFASQTHWPVPVLHSWPGPQDEHEAPPVPHDPFDCEAQGSHVPVLPLQQPMPHEFESQTHCPLPVLHSRPEAHPLQAAPLLPHEVFDSLDSDSQLDPLQQPAHDAPPHEHAPPEHVCPPPHGAQAAPPVPQEPVDCAVYVSQFVPLQHPMGHEVASQMHWPVVVLHSCPEAQPPHMAPPVPHEVLDCDE